MSNKYTYKVPFTEEQLFDAYINQKMSQVEVAAKFGTTQKVIWRAMIKMGIKPRKAAARNPKRGMESQSWKGGRVLRAKTPTRPNISDGGYWYVYAPEHPNAKGRTGYVAEHILVTTKRLGRPLQPGEHVHHVDLNKHNNVEDNLAVGTRKRHAFWHNQLEELAVIFMRKGWIKFDETNGYSLVKEVPNA